MRTAILNFLSFNRRERRGVTILLSILLLQIAWLYIKPSFAPPPPEIKFFSLADLPDDTLAVEEKTFPKKKFYSDSFKRKDSFRYNNWKKDSFKLSYKPKEKIILDLNTADSVELVKVRGIGAYTARKIIKYRDHLGGFHSIFQLMEIYNNKWDSATILEMNKNVTINISAIRKIKINYITIEDLKKHPYVTWTIARAIVSYREKHGKYSAPKDLLNTSVVSPELLEKLKYYLDFS